MSLLDYYRQYADIDEEEWNQHLRARRAREKALALEEVPALDLSGTEWPELPDSEVVNAGIYAARGAMNGYPDRHAGELRTALARRHDVPADQIAVGNGSAELLQASALVLLAGGGELVMPWPSYPLYPLMASRAGGRPVAVELDAGRVDTDDVVAAVGERTRAVVVCDPNDPTGTHLGADGVRALAQQLPEHVHLLVDEALVQFVDGDDEDATLRLVRELPRLLVFRTFSKIYGLSGLRTGYAVASEGSGELLDAISPALGVNAPSQAAALHALRTGDPEIDRRRATVIHERRRILAALPSLPLDAPESQANFLWLRAPGLSGAELGARLEHERILVAPGGPLGEEDHVRLTVQGARATDRLLEILGRAFGGPARLGGSEPPSV